MTKGSLQIIESAISAQFADLLDHAQSDTAYEEVRPASRLAHCRRRTRRVCEWRVDENLMFHGQDEFGNTSTTEIVQTLRSFTSIVKLSS